MDFCRYIFPAFCISTRLKAFEIAYLNYIPFIYLLLLLVFTRVCIKLHSKNFRLIIWLWNKLNVFLIHINARRDKIIDAFATVFFLAYANLVFTSIWTAFSPIIVWNAKNFSVEWQFHVYFDPDVEYYHGDHLYFVFFSSLFALFIVLPLPVLLTLYPIKCFRSLLFYCPIVNRHMGTINMFLNKFYGCYRDGLDGGRDMRSFVSLYYFVYWLFGLVFIAFSLGLYVNVGAIVFALLGFLIAVVRPYKKTFMNIADTLILADLALFSLLLEECSWQKTFSSSEMCYISLSILNMIVPLAVIIAFSYRVFIRIKKLPCCRQNIRDIHDEELVERASFNLDIDDAREIPDRLLQSEQHNHENNYGTTEQSLAQSYPR